MLSAGGQLSLFCHLGQKVPAGRARSCCRARQTAVIGSKAGLVVVGSVPARLAVQPALTWLVPVAVWVDSLTGFLGALLPARL